MEELKYAGSYLTVPSSTTTFLDLKKSKIIFCVKLQVNFKEVNCPLIIFKSLLGFLGTELFLSNSDNK